MNTHRHRWLLTACLLSASLLGGCASVIRLENAVDSHAQWPAQQAPAAGDRYRFERLPSQQQNSAAQDTLENLARTALDKVGLRAQTPETKTPPPWTVQVSARSVKSPYAPWDNPYDDWPRWHGYMGISRGWGGVGVMGPLFPAPRPPYYQREVSLLIRRSGSNEVVYETRARHDGPWHDSPVMWSALLDAALAGFPQPPSGTRQVVIEVPR